MNTGDSKVQGNISNFQIFIHKMSFELRAATSEACVSQARRAGNQSVSEP